MQMNHFDNTIKRSRKFPPHQSISIAIELLNAYHYIDEMDETEEVKVDLRHTTLNRLLAVKKKIPTGMRLSIESWMYDKEKWEEEKGDWAGL